MHASNKKKEKKQNRDQHAIPPPGNLSELGTVQQPFPFFRQLSSWTILAQASSSALLSLFSYISVCGEILPMMVSVVF